MLTRSTLCYISEITVLVPLHAMEMCSWRHLSRLSGSRAASITSSPGSWGRWSNVSMLDSHLNIQSSAARRSAWLCQCWVMHGSWSRSRDKSWLVPNVRISEPDAWPWGISVHEERSLIRLLIHIMEGSFLECLVQGCTFMVLCFIHGLTAVYHRRRNNGKLSPTDLNKTFQVVVAAKWYVENSSCPQTSSCLALSCTEMKSSLLNRPCVYTIPSQNWPLSIVKVEH